MRVLINPNLSAYDKEFSTGIGLQETKARPFKVLSYFWKAGQIRSHELN